MRLPEGRRFYFRDTMNNIYLRRRGKIYVKAGDGGATVEQVAVVQKEAEQLGFVLSEPLITRLGSLSVDQLTQFLRNLTADLRTMTGAHRPHQPLYPGFPEQVLRLPEAQLYLNAVWHYITLRRLPDEAGQRRPLLHGKTPRAIDLGTLDEFELIFTRLAAARTSLSAQDKADVCWFVRQYRADIFRLLPKTVSFKENLAVVGAQLLLNVPGAATEAFLRSQLKTATDVLRLAVGLADGDVSLATATKFKPLKRGLRKLLLSLVEATGAPTEDMRRWSERWKRLGEVIHPGEYAERFPATFAGFDVIRNDRPFHSFSSVVEGYLRDGEIDAAERELEERPGELARRLDHLLRRTAAPDLVVAGFGRVAQRVSTPVLLQVLSHFKHRTGRSLRAFFPKGDVANVFAIPDNRPFLSTDLTTQVVSICELALVERFSKLAPLGKCHLDPRLANFLAPLSQRSASRALRTLVRGSRLPLSDTPFIRLFVWWMNGRSRADVDLSVVLYGQAFNFVDAVAYYNLKSYGAYHSGDIVDAPRGAAEFIDLDLHRLRQQQVRFVVMSLNSFTEQPYCELPECFAGWMARTDLNSGQIFEPRTVIDRIDVAADTKICLPLVLDLQEECIVWMDIALKQYARWNNVHNNLSGVSLMLRALTGLVKPDLHTLFALHIRARGELVRTPDGADTIFSPTEGITPFDVDRIRADFL